MKNDCVAWCNLDPVGDHCQKSKKKENLKKKKNNEGAQKIFIVTRSNITVRIQDAISSILS